MTRKFIPLSVPNLKGNELKYVSNAINSEWVSTGGPYVIEFEEKISKYVNSIGAVSCQNGTAGIHIALKVCGITKNDEVIVPTLTFIAAVNPVKYVDAYPVFMDCDDNLIIDPKKIRKFCEKECTFLNGELKNKKTKRNVKCILVVHVFGNMANMEEIMEIASIYNLKVIEDATEALGTYFINGKYKNKYAGTIGDIGIYSFNGNKIITTGGGGMIVSNNIEVLKHAKHLTTQAKTNEVYFTHDEIGYNYRMTNLQAAMGIAQLEQLEKFIEIKKCNYDIYKKEINNIPGLKILDFNVDIRPNYWFYSLYINEKYILNRDTVIEYLMKNNIQTRPIWGLISNQIPYKDEHKYEIINAEKYLKHVINLPCSSNLSEDDVYYITNCLKNPQI